MLLELKNIKKSFKLDKEQEFIALEDINLSFEKGEFVSIVGPSGSGKSTLLNLIAGLDFPTSGELVIGDKTSKKFRKKDWDLYRKNNIGFIFQNFNLIEHLTALENVEIVMNLIGLSYLKRRKRATELLKEVGLDCHMNHRPSELSGGQKQRVAVARALANDPDIILADEPTGALDQHTGTQIMELIKSIAKEKLIIMVTHNNKLAEDYSSRIIKVKDGKIENDTVIKEEKKNNIESTLTKKDKAMSFFEAFKLSLRNMGKKKGRVAITTIAGCIGIIGFTLITGLGNGANIYIDKQLNKFGTANVLVVNKEIKQTNALGKEEIMTTKNSEDYSKILNDEYIKSKTSTVRQYIILNSATITVKKENVNVEEAEEKGHSFNLYALAEDKDLDFLKENVDGNLPIEGENQVLVNQATARRLLKDLDLSEDDVKIAIGKTIILTISMPGSDIKIQKEFNISGIANELDLGVTNIYYNYNDVANWSKGVDIFGKSLYSLLTENAYIYELVISDVNETKAVSDYISLKENGGSGKITVMSAGTPQEGYSANNMAIVIKNIFSQLIMMAQIVISIFIIIALIVSSIMTSIVLYSSIIERKTEIGIIKAVGGRNKDVIRIFESEAILMGIFSGVLGVAISFILAPILEKLISRVLNLNLPGIITIPISTIPFTNITFPFATIITIIAFSGLISAIAGYLPSKKATKMHVIDALRDE
ncbi:MAG: ATP-binding cassette domain-containing protein [Clostridia bacterium]|nr:ATP-binding cassette domain-containing protein [Clostridia bacterium]MDD4387257.1 ATP-binding cassette domain-containing protein [Clostridia bacterium]